jgi:hypothetical protein
MSASEELDVHIVHMLHGFSTVLDFITVMNV